MKTIKLTVFGRVQGVGFRYCTKLIADQIGISGTVHNNEDSSVTVIATADDLNLQNFISKIINNPSPTSKVTDYNLEEITLNKFDQFKII